MKQWKFPRQCEDHSLVGRDARTVWSKVVNFYRSTQSCLYACREGELEGECIFPSILSKALNPAD